MQGSNLLGLTLVTESEGGSVRREIVSDNEPTGGAILVYTERVDMDMGLEEGVEASYWEEGWYCCPNKCCKRKVE